MLSGEKDTRGSSYNNLLSKHHQSADPLTAVHEENIIIPTICLKHDNSCFWLLDFTSRWQIVKLKGWKWRRHCGCFSLFLFMRKNLIWFLCLSWISRKFRLCRIKTGSVTSCGLMPHGTKANGTLGLSLNWKHERLETLICLTRLR